ncbi:MAG: ABC transporter permease subunit [Stagnimonas sp.]|nr:ABC transporter permease subunit [Stagnimonas sp.]
MSALRRHPVIVIAGGLLAVLVLLILLGPLLSPYAVDSIDFDADWAQAPGLAGQHWFGTDSLGRDVFVRSLEGGRVSLLVGLAATAVSVLIGVAWGAVAGYFGGRLDELLMRAVDILYALPFLFLVILLMVLFGRQFWLVFVAIGAINWLDMARIVRGETLALREREFVQAARVSGLGDAAILLRQILPNLLGTVVVCATLTVPQVILTESFLSFLGLGVQEPATSWGALVSEGAREMERTPWALLFPAGLLALTLLCLNLLGDALRDQIEGRGR